MDEQKMMNRDWESFGEEIRKNVQDAIDAQDFNRLNQRVTDTVNSAVEGITKTIRNAGSAARRPMNPHCRETKSEAYVQPKPAELYRGVTSVNAGGTALAITGGVMGGVFLLLFVGFALGAWINEIHNTGYIIAMAVFLVLGTGGAVLGRWGSVLKGRVRRFRSYIRILGQREYCNVRELADGINKNPKYVLKDLEQMLQKGWFSQGHLDGQRTCLIVSHNMYGQYLKLEEDRKRSEEDKKAAILEKEQKNLRQQEENGRLSPQVRKVIEAGDAYVEKIRACNDAIPGAEISAKISRMETVIDRIFDRVEQNPEAVDDIRRMMDYYLPTTIKLLEAYQELDAQPVDGANIRSSKEEIEKTLDTLNTAFEKLLDSLFQDTAWDVSSDISVLRTMLAQEGLTEDGLRKERL